MVMWHYACLPCSLSLCVLSVCVARLSLARVLLVYPYPLDRRKGGWVAGWRTSKTLRITFLPLKTFLARLLVSQPYWHT